MDTTYVLKSHEVSDIADYDAQPYVLLFDCAA